MRQVLREKNRDAFAVGRPARVGKQAGEMRLLLRGAAGRGGDVELELIGFGAIGEKCDLGAIRRPGDGLFVARGFPIASADVDGRG